MTLVKSYWLLQARYFQQKMPSQIFGTCNFGMSPKLYSFECFLYFRALYKDTKASHVTTQIHLPGNSAPQVSLCNAEYPMQQARSSHVHACPPFPHQLCSASWVVFRAWAHLFNLFVDLARENGTTLVLVAHDSKLASKMKKIYHLSGGKLRSR